MTSDSPVDTFLRRVHERHAGLSDGAVATYIPELAKADPAWFGISLVTTDGAVYEVGDARRPFSIQSISKAFTFAVALDDLGPAAVEARVGVEPTGEAFNAIALHPTTGMPYNPMVNAGAITTTGLVVERDGDAAADRLLEMYGQFAGRRLETDEAVYRSELATAHRNRAIAHLLRGAGALQGDPERALDAYLRQCAVLVDARDLAVMAATLANGGVNPVSGQRVSSPETVGSVLSVMTTCGMYDSAGEWLYTVGLPAKSGVAGGIIAVLPGRLGIAVFSPPLDTYGNSVRGIAVCRQFAAELDLHVLRSDFGPPSPIRSTFTLTHAGSKRRRPAPDARELVRRGGEVIVVEVQGELDFAATELVLRRIVDAPSQPRFAVVDLSRVVEIHRLPPFATELDDLLGRRGGRLVLSGTPHPGRLGTSGHDLLAFDDLDRAVEWCEDRLLEGRASSETSVPLRDHEVVAGLDDGQLARLEAYLEHRAIAAGALAERRGQPLSGMFLLTTGRLSLLIGLEGGPARRIATVVAGMLLGERAMAGEFEAAADVVADTDVECRVLPVHRMKELRETEPEIWTTLLSNVVSIVAKRVDDLSAKLAVLV